MPICDSWPFIAYELPETLQIEQGPQLMETTTAQTTQISDISFFFHWSLSSVYRRKHHARQYNQIFIPVSRGF